MHWHRTLNWILVGVAVSLILVNSVRQGATVDRSGMSPSSGVTNTDSPSSLPIQRPTNLRPLQECKMFMHCRTGTGSSLPLSGPGFQYLDLFGEPWTERQMFHTVPPRSRVASLLRTSSEMQEIADACQTQQLIESLAKRQKFVLMQFPTTASSALFRISLISSEDGCSGFLVIDHQQGLPRSSLSTMISDSTMVEFVQSLRLGRDDYRVRFVGPEIVSSLLHTLPQSTSCSILPFRFSVSGTFNFELEQMYENYAAFDEKTTDTIPMVRLPLLPLVEYKGAKGEISGAQHHNPKMNLFHFHHPEKGQYLRKSKFRSSKLFTWDQFTYRSNESIICKQQHTQATHGDTKTCSAHCLSLVCWKDHLGVRPLGSWVRHHYNTSFPKDTPSQSYVNLEHHHVHFERSDPQAIYRYHLYEDVCPRPLLSFSPEIIARSLLKYSSLQDAGSSVVFIGDSHLRVTFTHFRNFFASASSCPLEDHSVKSMGSKTCTFEPVGSLSRGVTAEYLNDVLMENVIKSGIVAKRAAVVVLGMGSWALGGQGNDPKALEHAPPDFGRWKLSKYRRVCELIAQRITDFLLVNSNSIVVWVAIPAYPPNTRRFAKIKGEHRTNPRIFAFNQVAMRVLQEKVPAALHDRVRCVDAFDITYPMMHLSLDHNHFTTYPQDAVLHVLLHAMTPLNAPQP